MSHSFVPGPVDVDASVLAAQSAQMIPHRSPKFETMFHQAESKTRLLFGTHSRVFITASSGTGLQEAAVRNFANEYVLSCVNGAFGDRWHVVAQMNGKNADRLEIEWRHPLTPELVVDALKVKSYELVTIVHNETATGIQNPVWDIAQAVRARNPDIIICVDAVSSLGGVPVAMDSWGLDMVFTSSQKCLALPPGLGLGATSDRALTRAKSVSNRGWYFDLLRMEDHRVRNSTPATPAISLIYALALQLDRIMAEGLEARFARHEAMAARVQEWVLDRGFEIYAPEGYRSQTVTKIINNHDLEIKKLNAHLQNFDMCIANGYGPLRDKTFRIAHMGETRMEHINTLLAHIDDYMRSSIGNSS